MWTMSRHRRREAFEHYTRHLQGASFGTKFEGLKISKQIPDRFQGCSMRGRWG